MSAEHLDSAAPPRESDPPDLININLSHLRATTLEAIVVDCLKNNPWDFHDVVLAIQAHLQQRQTR